MRVQVLGDLEVVVGERVADLGGPKPRTLLALLVAADGRAVPVEHLIHQIWGEDPPARVEASLQSYVARLRRALDPERPAGRPAERLRTHPGGYSLTVTADEVDARRFARLVQAAGTHLSGEPAEAEHLLTEALSLWRGAAYSGVGGPALEAEATRLDELRMTAVEQLWDLRIGQGRQAEAVPELEQLVRLHPLREQLWALLARALYRSARQGDALAALRRVREHLAEELGVDPGPELRRLEELVLRQDPSLDGVTAAPDPAGPPSLVGQPLVGQPLVGQPLVGQPLVAPPPAVRRRLFGREDALAAAERVLRDALGGRGRTVIVTGEAGIGKTRFTEALIARAEAMGVRCGRGGWEAEACPALWGWTQAAEQLAERPGLLDPAPGGDVVDAAAASFRQAAALTAALRDGPPALLVLDDIHWADAESLRLLRRVGAQVAALPVVLVVALRSAPAEIGAAVVDALAALARTDPLRLELTGLDAAAIAAWVEEYAEMRVPAEVAAELAARTDGNPFYVTELVRLLVRDGALTALDAGAWRAVPGGVRDVVRQRLAQLPETSALVIGTAAVAGRSFDLLVVERAAGAGREQVAEAMESALMLGLIDELEPGRCRFSHALVRDAVYDGLPAPRRARAHAEVAIALEHRHAGALASHVAELAEHYRLAGPVHARSAWVFARRAGRAAAARSAHDEALRLLTEAEKLQHLDPVATPAEREEVLLGQAAALIRLGRPIEAWPAVARAAAQALGRDDVPAAADALLTITSGVWGWRNAGDWDDDAAALWEEVLARLPAERAETRALLQVGLAVELLYRPGSAARTTTLADEAVQAVRRSGAHDAVRFRVLRLAVQALLRPDLLHHRAPILDELVGLAVVLGDVSGLAGVLSTRAVDRAELGRLADAHADLLRADGLARQHQLPENLLVSGWCLATWRQLDGDLDGAEAAIAEMETFQGTLAMAGAGIGLCQLATLRLLQGRLPELTPALRGAAEAFPPFRELHALALVQDGRLDEARRVLGAWPEQPPLPWGYLWVGFTVFRAYTWMALGDRAAVADLRAQLTPYAGRLAGTLPVSVLGSVELVLGELAAADGDPVAARDHLGRARRTHEELGLTLWLARTDEAIARLAPPAG
ncbi:AfsR/SARP family transcriptional regulator [Paractinoplanes rishiriensis]|uniref:ATPase AAA n=1 Tax=Paractinoplanes rishiriensis TaxID=1050105 RepID=A0A919K6P2_9ACTN|nr:AfsR/SARP family transcriptional regulator [Actinoplanes rishiriensis]GIF01069.1 ATPase AAA [Actinoplanes rishiriensis]